MAEPSKTAYNSIKAEVKYLVDFHAQQGHLAAVSSGNLFAINHADEWKAANREDTAKYTIENPEYVQTLRDERDKYIKKMPRMPSIDIESFPERIRSGRQETGVRKL